MRHEMHRTQSKDKDNKGSQRANNSRLSHFHKSINHIEIILSNGHLILIFALVRRAILFTIFFYALKRVFFVQKYIRELFSKIENKKKTQKTIIKKITKKKKHCESIIGIFLKIKKNGRKNVLTSEAKICQMKIKKEKKNIWEIISIKEKLCKN